LSKFIKKIQILASYILKLNKYCMYAMTVQSTMSKISTSKYCSSAYIAFATCT